MRERGKRWRLAAAALLAVVLLVGISDEGAAQQRYVVQAGDTIESIAATFSVDPAAILAASWVADPENLQPGEVVVIPDPGQTPSEAALDAAAREGTSPWVVDRYVVVAGDTIEMIAATYGVTPAAIAELNGLSDPDYLEIGQALLIPPAPDAEAAVEKEGSFVAGVPTHVQERSLSCEYASAFIATSTFGAGIPESVFIEQVPPALNPHWGYRGDIDGVWGNTNDYGVYPEALAPVLAAYGFVADVFYAEGDPAPLIAHIDAGHPVAVWLGLWGDTAITLDDEGIYTVAAGAHTVIVYGYDTAGVYISDPADGSYRYSTWETFIPLWTVLDGMSLAIYPAW